MSCIEREITISYIFYFFSVIFLMSSFTFGCSHGKFLDAKTFKNIQTLNKGDLISIEFVDKNKINAMFLQSEDSKIIISTIENDIITQKSISVNLIYSIQKWDGKQSRQPNAFITFGFLIVVIGLLGWTVFISHIGSSY